MAVSLLKGGNISLSRHVPGLSKVLLGVGWSAGPHGDPDLELDAICFLLDGRGRVRSEADFVFYNMLRTSDGAVECCGAQRSGVGEGDDEGFKIDLDRLSDEILRLSFCTSIARATERGQCFALLSNVYVRVVSGHDNCEIARFDLGSEATTETAMIMAELYRYGGEWKFKAVGQGFHGGLPALARNFGVHV